MSKKYSIVKINSKKFGIFEQSTGLLLKTLKSAKVAEMLQEKLNKGSGFAGDTPPFFAEETPWTMN